jgi:hypothetical protein
MKTGRWFSKNNDLKNIQKIHQDEKFGLLNYRIIFQYIKHYTPLGAQDISVIPKPAEMEIQQGEFIFSDKTCLITDNESRRTAEFIQKRLKDGLGMVLNEGDSR